jgi:hypothetical protein
VLIIALLLHLVFNVVNYLLNGVCSYFLSLSFYLILGILTIPRFPKIAVLFFTLFIVELGLSQYSPYKSYNERNGGTDFTAPYFDHPKPTPRAPGHIEYDEKPEFDFEHHFNSLGFKDLEREQTDYFAFLLGDSFVQGVGTDSNNTIDKHLESMLDCENCILNMGLGGSELVNHYSLLSALLEQGYTAKYILLNINATDIDDLKYTAHNLSDVALDVPSHYFQFFYGISYLFRHFSHDLRDVQWNLLTPAQEKAILPVIEDLIIDYILKYYNLSKEQGSELFLIFQPMKNECMAQEFKCSNIIEKLKQDHPEINTIDLNHAFDNDCEAYFWPIDGHFNTKGYVTYSRLLFEATCASDTSFCEKNKSTN